MIIYGDVNIIKENFISNIQLEIHIIRITKNIPCERNYENITKKDCGNTKIMTYESLIA